MNVTSRLHLQHGGLHCRTGYPVDLCVLDIQSCGNRHQQLLHTSQPGIRQGLKTASPASSSDGKASKKHTRRINLDALDDAAADAAAGRVQPYIAGQRRLAGGCKLGVSAGHVISAEQEAVQGVLGN